MLLIEAGLLGVEVLHPGPHLAEIVFDLVEPGPTWSAAIPSPDDRRCSDARRRRRGRCRRGRRAGASVTHTSCGSATHRLGAAGFEGGEDLVGVERRVGFGGLDRDQRDVDRVAADTGRGRRRRNAGGITAI